MKNFLKILAVPALALFFVACPNEDDLSSSLKNGDNPISLCNGKEYDSKTEGCYGNVVACKMEIPECGGCITLKDCAGNQVMDESGTPVAELCYARPENCGLTTQMCNGKKYDPNTEECYNGNFIACKGQEPNECGGCVEHKDCSGNPVTFEDGTPIVICYERVRENCGLPATQDVLTINGIPR